jgi:hypothetical protein
MEGDEDDNKQQRRRKEEEEKNIKPLARRTESESIPITCCSDVPGATQSLSRVVYLESNCVAP